ncbi:hypothetical protein V2J09_012931 [Rumex salicifolius]
MPKIYTLEEASKHNTRDDCWVVINGKVYDVTKFLNKHPGGADVFFDVAGKDAKEEFEAAGHGFIPRMMMKFFCIGTLERSGDDEVSSEKKGVAQKVKELPLQYWVVPVAIVGISITIGFLYYNKKQ